MVYVYKLIKQRGSTLPVCQAERPSLCFHLIDYLIRWHLFPRRGHGLGQLEDVPFALVPGHANPPGLVCDFLTDSSASLLTE